MGGRPGLPGEKEGWRRRHPLLLLSAAQVTGLLQPAFPGAQVARTHLLRKGLCNTNYQVWLADGPTPFVLRLYVGNPAACERDVALDRLLAESPSGAGVPKPRVLYADSSCRLAPVPYAVLEWMDGVRLCDLRLHCRPPGLESAAYSIGQVLACIASHTMARPGFFQHALDLPPAGPVTDSPAAGSPEEAEASGQLPPYLDCLRLFLSPRGAGRFLSDGTTRRLHRLAETHAPTLDALMRDARLVHGDFNGPNLLLRKAPHGWQVAAVLDWEHAFSSTPLFDVGNLVRHADDAFVRAFARGYTEREGVLPDGWRRLARMLDLIPLCQMLSHPRQSEASLQELTHLVHATLDDGKP